MKKNMFYLLPILLVSSSIILSGCKHEPRYCKDDFPEKVVKIIDKSVKKLKLTEDQEKKYQTMRAEFIADLKKYIEERKVISRQVGDELYKDSVDMEKIAAIMKDNPPIREDMYRKAIDKFLEFYNILDEKQKKIITDKMQNFHKKFSCSTP